MDYLIRMSKLLVIVLAFITHMERENCYVCTNSPVLTAVGEK